MPPPKKHGPIFLGQPSPSLRKMGRMTQAELIEHLQRLQEQADHVAQRIQAAPQRTGMSDEKLHDLTKLHERLNALKQEGQRLYRIKG